MTTGTENILATVLMADASITDDQKRRVLQILRSDPAEAPQAPPVKLLKRTEVAKMLGCTPQSVDYYCRKGWLRKTKLGSQSRASGIAEEAVLRFMQGNINREHTEAVIA